MKKASFLALFLAAAALIAAGPARKEITVAPGETRTAAINGFNARLLILGRLDESVFLLGGSLRLDGEVSGDVICIAAEVEIGDKAVIGKDLIVIGGRLRKSETSRVAGALYNIRTGQDLKKIAASVLPFLPDAGGLGFFKVIKIFFWLILCLLALAVVPAALAQAAAMLRQSPLRQLGRGLLTLLGFLLLLLFSLLLSFVLIGIPLLIALVAAYFLLLVFGRATVLYFIGERLAGWLKLRANATLFIFLGAAVYALLKFTPLAGVWLLLILDLFALGVGASYILRRKKSLA